MFHASSSQHGISLDRTQLQALHRSLSAQLSRAWKERQIPVSDRFAVLGGNADPMRVCSVDNVRLLQRALEQAQRVPVRRAAVAGSLRPATASARPSSAATMLPPENQHTNRWALPSVYQGDRMANQSAQIEEAAARRPVRTPDPLPPQYHTGGTEEYSATRRRLVLGDQQPQPQDGFGFNAEVQSASSTRELCDAFERPSSAFSQSEGARRTVSPSPTGGGGGMPPRPSTSSASRRHHNLSLHNPFGAPQRPVTPLSPASTAIHQLDHPPVTGSADTSAGPSPSGSRPVSAATTHPSAAAAALSPSATKHRRHIERSTASPNSNSNVLAVLSAFVQASISEHFVRRFAALRFSGLIRDVKAMEVHKQFFKHFTDEEEARRYDVERRWASGQNALYLHHCQLLIGFEQGAAIGEDTTPCCDVVSVPPVENEATDESSASSTLLEENADSSVVAAREDGVDHNKLLFTREATFRLRIEHSASLILYADAQLSRIVAQEATLRKQMQDGYAELREALLMPLEQLYSTQLLKGGETFRACCKGQFAIEKEERAIRDAYFSEFSCGRSVLMVTAKCAASERNERKVLAVHEIEARRLVEQEIWHALMHATDELTRHFANALLDVCVEESNRRGDMDLDEVRARLRLRREDQGGRTAIADATARQALEEEEEHRRWELCRRHEGYDREVLTEVIWLEGAERFPLQYDGVAQLQLIVLEQMTEVQNRAQVYAGQTTAFDDIGAIFHEETKAKSALESSPPHDDDSESRNNAARRLQRFGRSVNARRNARRQAEERRMLHSLSADALDNAVSESEERQTAVEMVGRFFRFRVARMRLQKEAVRRVEEAIAKDGCDDAQQEREAAARILDRFFRRCGSPSPARR